MTTVDTLMDKLTAVPLMDGDSPVKMESSTAASAIRRNKNAGTRRLSPES